MLMKLLFFEATAISLVECFFVGCYYNPLSLRTDLEPLCWKWWDKAVHDYGDRDSSRGDCVNLIKKKCPQMITVERFEMTRSYDSGQYEEWNQDAKATLNSDTSRWLKYVIQQKHDVCWDNNGKEPNCAYWWKVATMKTAEDKYKKRCIDRILNHCPSMLRKVSENTDTVQRCLIEYGVKTVTYKRASKGDKASFKRYDPAE